MKIFYRQSTLELGNSLKRNLALPMPTLPGGNTPPYFIGHAVNMINLAFHYIYTSITK